SHSFPALRILGKQLSQVQIANFPKMSCQIFPYLALCRRSFGDCLRCYRQFHFLSFLLIASDKFVPVDLTLVEVPQQEVPTKSVLWDLLLRQSDQAACFGIVTLCCRVKSSRVSLGIFTWSPLVTISEATPTPAPVPAPMAAPFPPPASAPMMLPMAAPPTVLFAVLSPLDLPETSYSPVTSGTVWPWTTIPVSSSSNSDLPVKVPVSFDSSNRP